MNHKGDIIEKEKSVLKAAQSVWSCNKYFILACGQQYYRKIRQYLKQDDLQLDAAYQLLKEINEVYKSVPVEELPEIRNALYHIAGYFKKELHHYERQYLNNDIKKNMKKALYQLQQYTINYQVHYLLHSNIWPNLRDEPFNLVSISIAYHEKVNNPRQVLWQGSYLIVM